MNLCPAIFVALLSLPHLLRAAPDVTVVVDMTPEGRALPHPTPEHPAYYAPVIRGYHEMGDHVAGERPVSPHELIRVLAPELAKQGYRVIDDAHRSPDLIIDFSWGKISRNESEDVHNKAQRYALTLGHSYLNVQLPESYGREIFLGAAYDDSRYFIVVTAFDYGAWNKQHRNLILWKAKMSLSGAGAFFDDVLVSLAKAGGPSFGRETSAFPKLVPSIPEGHVDVGTPSVKTDPEPSSASAR